MKDPCAIVQDLLPLYREHLTHPNSAAYVEAHLATCAACRSALEELDMPTAPPFQSNAPLLHLRRSLQIRKLQAVFFAVALACALLLTFFSRLTAPQYIPYDQDLVSVSTLSDGTSIVVFAPEVTGYSCEWTTSGDQKICFLTAWSTVWDQLFSQQGPQSLLIPAGTMVLYSSNNGTSDTILLGGEFSDAGVISLPRLTLGYYLLLALAALAILLLLRLIFRKHPMAACWLERLALLPAAYLLAHLAVKGLEPVTYSLPRDFAFLLAITCSLTAALQLLLLRLRHTHPL